MILAIIAVAHFAQADSTRHVLQFAIAIGGAGEAIERMVGDVELHDALAQRVQGVRLGADDHAFFCGGGAGGGGAATALDLDETETARAEGLERIGGAEFRDFGAHAHRGGHDGGACRNADADAVNCECDGLFRDADRGAVIEFFDERHGALLTLPPACVLRGQNLQGNGSGRSGQASG